MYEQIIQNLSRIIHLDDAEIQAFCDCLKFRQLKRKELLLREGEVCRHAYFINSGCLRYFYNIDGQENTAQFFFENSWYADYESYLTGKPSRQNIETLEKTEILILAKADLERLFVEIPPFEKFGRLMAENAFLGLHKRSEMLTNQLPETRYLTLIKERPKVIERVPQHYIASYLGIKAPSLSRIRKRILDNK